MLDGKWIREHQEQVQQVAEDKGIELSVPELLHWDDQRRALLQEVERIRQERNRLTPQIEVQIREQGPDAAAALKEEVKQLNRRLSGLE